MPDNLGSLQIVIERNAAQAEGGLRRLTESLSSLKSAIKGGVGLTTVARQIDKFNTALNATNIAKLDQIASSLGRIKGVGNLSMPDIKTPDVSGAQGATSAGSEAMQNAAEAGREAAEVNREASSTAQELANAEKQVASETDKVSDSMKNASVHMSAGSRAANAVGNAFRAAVEPIRNFFRQLGRMVMMRAFRTMAKALFSGLIEGTQNLALYSSAVHNADSAMANSVLSSYASQFAQLKNTVGAETKNILIDYIY